MKKVKLKNKRVLALALPAITLIAIGTIIAYSHDRATFSNNFKLAGYQTIFTETFDAPENWLTCETIDKTITATNDTDSSGSISVRIKLEEQWLAADGVTELPLVSAASGLTMAQINFTQDSGWTKIGDYYYYDVNLAKGETTTSLISGVTLNCDANLSTTQAGSDGAYADGTYRLKITAQATDSTAADRWRELAKIVEAQASPDAPIDFTQKATIAVGNGNGVNRATEKGQNVYYYRGEVNDNNVIWANKCWKIVRTTYTGGTKLIYNGVPSDVVVGDKTVKQCLSTFTDSRITVNINNYGANSFAFSDGNDNYNSPADVGYMYGIRLKYKDLSPSSSDSFIFSNNVSRTGDIYTLDTSAGQSISGAWNNVRMNAATRYHYFCTNGASSCNGDKIGYINSFDDSIYYLSISGYDNIEDLKAAMFANEHDSNVKTMVETWFEQQNLDGHIANTRNYEDDLEDAIFCNDRSYYSGSLKGKDSDATPSGYMKGSYHGAYGRNVIKDANNNLNPSLDCADKNDSFTKNDATNGNAKLKYKIGLITADELTMAGKGWYGYDASNYLSTGSYSFIWSGSPVYFGSYDAAVFYWYEYDTGLSSQRTRYLWGLRPLVSLKAGTKVLSGTGLKTDPYIVE